MCIFCILSLPLSNPISKTCQVQPFAIYKVRLHVLPKNNLCTPKQFVWPLNNLSTTKQNWIYVHLFGANSPRCMALPHPQIHDGVRWCIRALLLCHILFYRCVQAELNGARTGHIPQTWRWSAPTWNLFHVTWRLVHLRSRDHPHDHELTAHIHCQPGNGTSFPSKYYVDSIPIEGIEATSVKLRAPVILRPTIKPADSRTD